MTPTLTKSRTRPIGQNVLLPRQHLHLRSLSLTRIWLLCLHNFVLWWMWLHPFRTEGLMTLHLLWSQHPLPLPLIHQCWFASLLCPWKKLYCWCTMTAVLFHLYALCDMANESDSKTYWTAEEIHCTMGCQKFRNYRHLLLVSNGGVCVCVCSGLPVPGVV